MMDQPYQRKPRMGFDTGRHQNANHVTFDDGAEIARNFPWTHFVEARWSRLEPDLIEVDIGEWSVAIRGHNLGPLFEAIEDQTLLRIRPRLEMQGPPDWTIDTFATEIRFRKTGPSLPVRRRGQAELDLGV
jgi:hypothetical protein